MSTETDNSTEFIEIREFNEWQKALSIHRKKANYFVLKFYSFYINISKEFHHYILTIVSKYLNLCDVILLRQLFS
jgi:hypothetical protein